MRPEECFDRIVDALGKLAEQAAPHGITIGIENEHACNIATAAETARVLAAVDASQPAGGLGSRATRWSPARIAVPGGVRQTAA